MIHVFSTIITQKLNNSISMLFIILFVTFKKGRDKKIKNKNWRRKPKVYTRLFLGYDILESLENFKEKLKVSI